MPEDAEVTLAFVDDRIAGKSACNRYSATIKNGENVGEIKVGQSISTRMACPNELMIIEQEYLRALTQTSNFSFMNGKLTFSGQNKDGESFTMLFDRRPQ